MASLAARLEALERIGDDLLELEYQARRLRLLLTLRAGFRQDQPRVPAGGPEGGQWTRDGGGDSAPPVGSVPSAEAPAGMLGGDSDVYANWDHGGGGDGPNSLDGLIDPVQYRGWFHDQTRDDIANRLREQGAKVETAVPLTIPGPPPLTAILDIMTQDSKTGQIYGIEIKTGERPTYTPAQRIVYPDLIIGNIVSSSSPKISTFGFTQMSRLPRVNILEFYLKKSGENPLFEWIKS